MGILQSPRSASKDCHPASSCCHLWSASAISGRHPGAFGVSGTPPGSHLSGTHHTSEDSDLGWWGCPSPSSALQTLPLGLSPSCPGASSCHLSVSPSGEQRSPHHPRVLEPQAGLDQACPGGRSSAQVPGVGGWGRYRDHDHSQRNKVGCSGLLGGADVDWLEPRNMGQGQKEGPVSQGPG